MFPSTAVCLALLQGIAGQHTAVRQHETCDTVRSGPDPCLPHAKTNILSGKCGDSGSQNPDVNTSCYTCYTGETCSELIPDCDVIVECGWPLMFSEVCLSLSFFSDETQPNVGYGCNVARLENGMTMVQYLQCLSVLSIGCNYIVGCDASH